MALLGLYSLVLLHNAVPHVHFDEAAKSEVAVHDGHSHSHDGHHHGQENNSNWFDLLLALLGDTSHQVIGPDHFDNYIAQNIVKVDARQTIAFTAIVYTLFTVNIPETGAVPSTTDPPPLLYDSTFSSSDPQRGPPSVA